MQLIRAVIYNSKMLLKCSVNVSQFETCINIYQMTRIMFTKMTKTRQQTCGCRTNPQPQKANKTRATPRRGLCESRQICQGYFKWQVLNKNIFDLKNECQGSRVQLRYRVIRWRISILYNAINTQFQNY